jgi:phage terminase small subunit
MAKAKKKPAGKAAKPEADDAWGDDGLTLKQRLFVIAYTGVAGGNGKQAAQIAGYSGDDYALATQGSINLTKPNVREAIGLALSRKCLTPEWAKERLAEIARSSINHFVTDGKVDLVAAEKAGALGQLKEVTFEDDGSVKVKVHDPLPAINTILKMHGLLEDRVRMTGAPQKAFIDVDDGGDGKP